MTTKHQATDPQAVREMVRQGYAAVALAESACCIAAGANADAIARRLGYSANDLRAVPAGANLGLGCGNPLAIARPLPGEVVLDLGSGAGFDALLAAPAVGPSGRVIGVDMTDAMLDKARANAAHAGVPQVEFRKGYIEHLPVDDASVDVIISNCVINLSPDKPQVFREAYRVLRPGGRLALSDIVLDRPLPPPLRDSLEAYVGCVAGAMLRDEYLDTLRAAGFVDVTIVDETRFGCVIGMQSPELVGTDRQDTVGTDELGALLDGVLSLKVVGHKARATKRQLPPSPHQVRT